MTLHLLKLCVGAESVEDLEHWIAGRLKAMKARGEKPEQVHTTRMVPKRGDELLDGGSLYWVVKGNVQCRQRLLDIRPFVDQDGISRCNLVMEPTVVLTQFQPRRAFQGWRYLQPKDAPADMAGPSAGLAALPAGLRQDLATLGLL
jgi:hypothetical protein